MKFERQIKALSELSWHIKDEIDRTEVVLREETISGTYRAYLEMWIEHQREEMRINLDAVVILMRNTHV